MIVKKDEDALHEKMEKLLKQEDMIRVAEEAMEAALSGEVRIMLSVR